MILNPTTTHRAVEKTLDILLTFAPHNRQMGTQELSEKMGFHKSTASRLLHVLCKKGFLQQNPITKKFQLGPSAMAIGVAIIENRKSNATEPDHSRLCLRAFRRYHMLHYLCCPL